MAIPGALVANVDVEERDAVTVRNQIASPLLRLPTELRGLIWEYTLAVNRIEFLPYTKILPHFCTVQELDIHPSKPLGNKHVRYFGLQSLLDVRRACRQIYAETEGLVFGVNVFCVQFPSLDIAIDKIPEKVQATVKTVRFLTRSNNMFYSDHAIIELLQSLKKLPKLKRLIVIEDSPIPLIQGIAGPDVSVIVRGEWKED